MDSNNVAVIGTGPAGLAALKSLLEEGFNVVAFERRDAIGGVWSHSPDPTFTTVLDDTVSNISKFVCGFSDFPFPQDTPAYFTGAQAANYFESYARHFQLHQHIYFNTTVTKVVRGTSHSTWDVHITSSAGESVRAFDKVVFAYGCENVPVFPPLPGRDKFEGIVMHSQAYRDPTQFKDKTVLVVGNGNTACELSVNLAKVTSKIYQSYRRGRIMFSRRDDEGIPLDSQFTWPGLRLKYFLDRIIPWLTWPIADRFMRKRMISYAARSEPARPGDTREKVLQRTEKKMRDDWRLLPCASTAHTHPAVQEDYIPALRNGTVTPVHGFKAFLGEHKILLEDGSTVEVDAVVFCTGYRMDFSIMPELEMDGVCGMPLHLAGDNSTPLPESREPQLPRLYQMIFPPRYADSIAFISWIAPQESVWCVSELVAMAVAQIWAASAARDQELDDSKADVAKTWPQLALLPSERNMNSEVDAYHKWFRTAWKTNHSVRSGYVHSADTFYRFLHQAAGTGLYQKLDHILTGRGWRLWWKDHELWTWLAKGPMNSYSWRLFETNQEAIPGYGRKVWPGAREAIKAAYEACEEHKRQVKRGNCRQLNSACPAK